jgi:phage anti-repressor protein
MIDGAKEMVMLERIDQGKRDRGYFIDWEKPLRTQLVTPASPSGQTSRRAAWSIMRLDRY